MTAREMIKSALKLLGYTEANGNGELPSRILNRAVPLINIIYSELAHIEGVSDYKPIKTLTDELKLSERVLSEVMPSGVAMLIATGEGDGVEQQLWTDIYNRKKAILTRIEERADGLPRSFEL